MHLYPSGLTAVVLAIAVWLEPTAAFANAVTDVSTDPTGAHVVLTRRDTWVEVGQSTSTGTQQTGCRRRWRLAPTPNLLRPIITGDYKPIPLPPPPTPEHRPYHVFCDAAYVTTVWLLPTQFTAGAPPSAFSIAQRLARDLPYPTATVGASPSLRGLTGLESWFWVEGYSGTPIRDTVTGFGLRIDVEAVPGSVTWDFGDGTPTAFGTLGSAAPARSDIVHIFERKARLAPFAVRAVVRLDVRWRQNGGAWQTLAPVQRTATRAYPVIESRAVLVPPG